MHRAWLLGFLLVGIAVSAPIFASGNAAAASTTGTVQIVYPLNNAVFGIAGTRVQLAVTNFVLDPNSVPCLQTNHGRIRLYLNDAFVQETSDTNTSLASLLPADTKLGAQLVCTDSSSFSPQVWHNITIQVGEPQVKIIRPPAPRTLSTAGARIEYTITNFSLDPADYGGPYIPGQGHVHLLLNGTSLIGTSTALTADLSSVPVGSFNLTVELHNNDHSLVKTASHPFGYNDTITATGFVPSIRIVSPSRFGSVSASGFRLTVAVAGIELDAENYGGANIPGHGHVHYFIDGGGLAATSTAPYVDFGALPPGSHTFEAELHNNDHSLYTDPTHPLGFNATVTVSVVETSIAIVTPANNAQVSTMGFRIQLRVDGFDISPSNYGGTNVPGQGHVHFYEGAVLLATATSTTLDLGTIPAGVHTIKAELHNNDHSLYTDASHPDGFNATITVTASGPSITLNGPANNTQVSTRGMRVSTIVSGFILDQADYGGANIAGEGHIHYSVDGALAAATVATYFDIPSLTPGVHVIRAELRNNDHSALTPAVFTEVTVTAVAPSITILSPTTAATAALSTLGTRVVVSVQGWSLSATDYGGAVVPGEGHVHYYLDGALASATAATSYDFASLPSGAHTIMVELVNNDHTSLSPAVVDTVNVVVNPPTIAIVSPAANAAVSSGGFRITVAVTGIELDPENYGGANIPGHGHAHFYEGTTLLGTATTTWFDVVLGAGMHTIRAELRNNDHSALSPAVSATVTVAVGPSELRILEPLPGATVSTLGFRMRFAVSNFTIDSADYGGAAIPGQGHIHVYNGATLLTTTVYDHTIIAGLTAGAVTLRVDLRNNDHSSLTTPVATTVSLTVAAPAITLTAPASITVGEGLVLRWTVTGFILDASAFGGAPEAGRGHVHVFVDGAYVVATPGTAFEIQNLAVGSHTIRVDLYNNDHSPLATPVTSSATVTVTQAPGATVDASVFYGSIGILGVIVIALAVLLRRRGRSGPPTAAPPEEVELEK